MSKEIEAVVEEESVSRDQYLDDLDNMYNRGYVAGANSNHREKEGFFSSTLKGIGAVVAIKAFMNWFDD